MSNSNDVIATVQQLAIENNDIAAVWLYGSRSKGTAQVHSDYDIAVAFYDYQLSVMDRYLRPNMLAIDWCERLGLMSDMLSIVDINSAPIYLAYDIVETGKLLYGQDNPRVWQEQDRIRSQFEFQLIENKRHDRVQ